MGNQKPLKNKKSKYWMPYHTAFSSIHYALNYNEFKAEADALLGVKGMNYDGMPHSSNVGNPTESMGMRYAELNAKCREIEGLCELCAGENAKWLLMYVANERISYTQLVARGLLLSERAFRDIKWKFYYLLAKKKNLF